VFNSNGATTSTSKRNTNNGVKTTLNKINRVVSKEINRWTALIIITAN